MHGLRFVENQRESNNNVCLYIHVRKNDVYEARYDEENVICYILSGVGI